MNLSHLIHDWAETRPKLKNRVNVISLIPTGLAQDEDIIGQIKMRVVGADVYDPEIWIAIIEPTRVVFRCDLRPYIQVYEEHVVEAEDPKFFKKLEALILKFSL